MAIKNSVPLYVVSKGRHDSMLTSRALTLQGAQHYIVIEEQENDAYAEAIKSRSLCAELLHLPMQYKEQYELLDRHGLERSTGPGPARNFAWAHSIQNGHDWHWVMDDNIQDFYRLNRNRTIRVQSEAMWQAMADFCARYENVSMAGPNYEMFVSTKAKVPPFVLNTRIYSCNLIRNDVPFKWRGRYNEDTILSLDMLKAGWCTIQFNSFLQKKIGTQRIKGGNTKEFYHAEGKVQPGEKYADTGTHAKSNMLAAVHPDVSRVAWKFNRVHHQVDYSPFKRNMLIKRPDNQQAEGNDEYGMVIRQRHG